MGNGISDSTLRVAKRKGVSGASEIDEMMTMTADLLLMMATDDSLGCRMLV